MKPYPMQVVFDESGRSLRAEQERVWRGLEDGVDCCSCGQRAALYKRRLRPARCRMLITLVRHAGMEREWVHCKQVPLIAENGGTFAKLRYWHFIEERINNDTKKAHSGWWRPTSLGIRFIYGEFRVPEYIVLYDTHFWGYMGEWLNIHQAMTTEEFDFEELMGRLPKITDYNLHHVGVYPYEDHVVTPPGSQSLIMLRMKQRVAKKKKDD